MTMRSPQWQKWIPNGGENHQIRISTTKKRVNTIQVLERYGKEYIVSNHEDGYYNVGCLN